MSSMNKKEQLKTTTIYHERAIRPEGLTMLVLLLKKTCLLLLLLQALHLVLPLYSTALILHI